FLINHYQSKKTYYIPKIHYHFNQECINVNLKRAQRLMKKLDIQFITVKKFRPTPSKEKVVERDNLLQRYFRAQAKHEKWVGDITYIHTLQHGWCYLASVMDLHTKKIVGFSFDRMMTTEL